MTVQASNPAAGNGGILEQKKFAAAAQGQLSLEGEISDDFLTRYFNQPIEMVPDWAAEIAAKLVMQPA